MPFFIIIWVIDKGEKAGNSFPKSLLSNYYLTIIRLTSSYSSTGQLEMTRLVLIARVIDLLTPAVYS